MATTLRYLPVFASALVLACPQALCCCLWMSHDAPAPVATCCAKLTGNGSAGDKFAGNGHSDRTPNHSDGPCQPGLRCCGQSVSALPEKPLAQPDHAPLTSLFAPVFDQPFENVATQASREAHAFLPEGVDPLLHVQLCVWRC
jgi:hypothetical protein